MFILIRLIVKKTLHDSKDQKYIFNVIILIEHTTYTVIAYRLAQHQRNQKGIG